MTAEKTQALAYWLFLGFLILYAAILLSECKHGLGSLDGHGIITATRNFIENGRHEVSRPPGHPTTEIYIFGAIGWILKSGFGHSFDDRTYLIFQALIALATLTVFYNLLRRLGTGNWRALLATICLALSAQYFSNAIDGEEFISALFFILLAIGFLLPRSGAEQSFGRPGLSILCFALAVGCRPEAIFAIVIYPVFCRFRPGWGWKHLLGIVIATLVAVLLVWLPVLFHGIRAPYQIGMNFRDSILGGGYKLVFQTFTLPVFVILCGILLYNLGKIAAHLRQPFPNNFVLTISCLIPVIFFALFFYYASKPSFLLITLPFLLTLAVTMSDSVLVALAVATLLGCFIEVDIFRERRLTAPFLTAGSYARAVRGKPYYKTEYFRALSKQCSDFPTLIIADAWPWDFDYHVAHRNFAARPEIVSRTETGELKGFGLSTNPDCVFLPRNAAWQTNLLELWQANGYRLVMDATLYRTIFAKYDVTTSLGDSARVGNLSVKLFSISPLP